MKVDRKWLTIPAVLWGIWALAGLAILFIPTPPAWFFPVFLVGLIPVAFLTILCLSRLRCPHCGANLFSLTKRTLETRGDRTCCAQCGNEVRFD